LAGALPVELTGEGTSVFYGLTQPNINTLAPGESTFFTAQYSPVDYSEHTVQVSIETEEGTFTYFICASQTSGKIIASDEAENDNFGRAVSISGDHIIVGAPYGDGAVTDSGSAYILSWNGTSWDEEELSLDGADSDKIGCSVCISGEWAIVGASSGDGVVADSGSAYILSWNGTSWDSQEIYAAGGAQWDYFGCSVSISGEWAVVGANGDGDFSTGAVYVFHWDGSSWTEYGDKLTAGDPATWDYFGSSVSISGDRLIVGAYGNDDNGSNSGSAYVFRLNEGTWVQEKKLTPSDSASGDEFGRSVCISGTRAIVGAHNNDDQGGSSGSAYIFKLNGSTWEQEQKLTASDGASSDYFGWAVSMSGEKAIVGAYGDDDNEALGSGSAYVFRYDGSTWVQDKKYIASDGAQSDRFGYSVAISDTWTIAGAYYDDNTTSNSGSIYLFYSPLSTWNVQKLTASDGNSGDWFGRSVSVSGDWAVVGAVADDDNGENSGSASIYRWDGTSWDKHQDIVPSNPSAFERFGCSVCMSGERVIVGASQDNNITGAAYIFSLNGDTWEQMQKLTASDGAEGDWFGYSVSISGDRAIVGAYRDADEGLNYGSAYIFHWNGSAWEQQPKLTASIPNSYFGYRVSISGDRAIVGAYYDSEWGGDYYHAGAAYIFHWNGNSWEQEQKIFASDRLEYHYFGSSVALYDEWAIVGAHGHDGYGNNSGAAYLFKFNGSSWEEKQIVYASDGALGHQFGYSAAISEDRAIVGAYTGDGLVADCGAAYIFYLDGDTWIQEKKLFAYDGADSDEFGYSVSISGEHAVVGAYEDDDKGTDSGSAYFYRLLSQ